MPKCTTYVQYMVYAMDGNICLEKKKLRNFLEIGMSCGTNLYQTIHKVLGSCILLVGSGINL